MASQRCVDRCGSVSAERRRIGSLGTTRENTMQRNRVIAGLVGWGVLVTANPATAGPPVSVSPTGQAGACPTFSWTAARSARGYELAVYRIEENGAVGSRPLARTVLPEGATSWTLPASDCLQHGQHYAWSIRATNDGSQWSEPALLLRESRCDATRGAGGPRGLAQVHAITQRGLQRSVSCGRTTDDRASQVNDGRCHSLQIERWTHRLSSH